MPVFTIFALGQSNISITGMEQLSGLTQGNGSHLLGETITLNNNNWEAMEVFDSDNNFGDSDNSQRLEGAQTFDGVAYADNRRVEAEYALTLQDPDGNTYTVFGFNINEPGVRSFNTVEGLAFEGGVAGFPPRGVPLTVIANQEGPSTAFANLATPPCFTPGTVIDTPSGPMPVEDIREGDAITTRDDGPARVNWVGRVNLPAAVLARDARFRPIRVRRDAFAPGVPNRDIELSPNHRVLVTGWQAELLFGEEELLVPIKKLVNDHSIRPVNTPKDQTYFHIMFDRHQIVMANGMPSESFLASANSDCPTNQEILRLFPKLGEHKDAMTPARTIVQTRDAQILAPISRS